MLNATPLLLLTPLKRLAKIYVTTPQVLAELRDPRAREHFQKLVTEGLDILVKSPDVGSYSEDESVVKWRVSVISDARDDCQ
jgi:RNA-binding protein NOB1